MNSELAVIGADTANQQAGGPSFFERATMFTGSAALSGLSSIYNTFVDYGSMVGVDAEQIDVSRVLENYDQNWYGYYKENEQLIDVAGFIGSSMIPGTLAVKGLKAAQMAKSAGAIGRAVQGPLAFPLKRRDEYLQKALKEMATEGGSAFSYINANKLASVSWGVADNILQGAAFEAAVVLSMNNSPVLADASKTDILSDMAFGAMVGGVFGGAIDGIMTNRVLKDAVKQLGGKQRTYDTPANYSGLGLGIGDEAYGFVDSVLTLPKEILADDKVLTVRNVLSKQDVTLDIEKLMKKSLTSAERDAVANVQLTLQKLGTENTPEVGEAFSGFIMGMIRNGQTAGKTADEIKQSVGDYLLGLKKVKTITDDAPLNTSDPNEVFYLADSVNLDDLAKAGNDIGTFLEAARSRTPFTKNATAKPYRVVGDISQAKITATVSLFNEAWEQGFDMAIIGGKLRINPKSEIFRQVEDPLLVPTRYINTRTGGVSDEVVATWADMLPAGVKPEDFISKDGVLYGKQREMWNVADTVDPQDHLVATARHAWASRLTEKEFTGLVLDFNDISRLERLAELNVSDEVLSTIKYRDNGLEIPLSRSDISTFLMQAKVDKAVKLLDEGVTDMRQIAYTVNAPEEWLERLIAEGLRYTDELTENMSRPLASYMKRENFTATWESPQSLIPFFGKEAHTLPIEITADGKRLLAGTKAVDSTGNPIVFYHGTTFNDVTKPYKPGTANSIFFSTDPKFSKAYAGNLGHIRPVYLNVKNPFDYGNPAQVEQLVDHMIFQRRRYLDQNGIFTDISDDDFDIDYLKKILKKQINRLESNWGTLESDDIQIALKELGHDGYYITELNTRNIAVYSNDQIVSVFEATGRAKGFKEILEATQKAAAAKGAKYADPFVTGDLGFRQRLEIQKRARDNAFASVFGGEDAGRFMELDPRNAIKLADELGVGAGALSFSNANYGEYLKLWAQHTGKLTHQLIQKTATANLEKLQPFIGELTKDKRAGAELGVILTMLRRSSDKFVIVEGVNNSKQLVVREATKVDKATGVRLIDNEKLAAWQAKNAGKEASFNVESEQVMRFLETWRDINADRIAKRGVIMNARGATLGWDPDVIYAPPINTQKFPYFAFVKVRGGHIAGGSDVGMITARSAEELSKLAREVPEQYEVFFKKDTEQFYKVKNEYDAQLALNEPRVNSDLRKQGKLGDFFPEVRPENVLEDFISYSQHADAALVRHGVETKYAQLVTELQALGKQYTEVATSQMSGLSRFYDKKAVDPFGDYVRTALDISKRSSFPLLHQLNEFVDSVGTSAYRILIANREKAKSGTISWQEAEKLATKYGIGGAFNAENAEAAFAIANRPMDRNIIKEGVSKLNMFLATVGLRLDFANSLVNIVSMPIMLGTELASLKSLAKRDPEALGVLQKAFTTTPDGQLQVPSYTKLIGNAIKNVMGKDGKKLIESYRDTGDVKNVVLQFHEMLDELAINPRVLPSEWSKKLDGAIETASKWTGNNFSEDFTRAVSANVMDQLTQPLVAKKLLTPQEAEAYRSVFVNRVNGNYIASQRPIMFQGTVGAAVSLFQTYMFNVMQQLVRHIENRDLRALMTMGGLQGGIYGLNGLPFFDAVNTHLIGNANINDGHRDIYSSVTQLAGKELGDWMLYGTASAFPLFNGNSPALYTRGDLNPRHVSVLPISPLDVPAVDVSIRVAKNLYDMGSKVVAGQNLGSAFLEGLEHNGVSRPLAGFAQLIQGYASTSKGSLISANNEFDLTVAATRMMGAKPMDESVALNTMYRLNAYKAADLDRLSRLGEVVKSKLRAGQMPDDEEMQDFMRRYASAGGNLQSYARALQRWSRDANMSVVEQMKNFHHSSYAQRLTEIMGGTTLDDFVTATSTQ